MLLTVAPWRARLIARTTELSALLPHAAVEGLRAPHYARLLGLPDDEIVLCEVAALIHDIGKIPSLVRSGFHPLDGATYVRAEGGDERLAALVAHHSGAVYEATLRGITVPYPREESMLSQIVDWCDLTTLQSGQVVTLDERRADIVERYGASSPQAQALERLWPELLETERRIQDSLSQAQFIT